MKRKLIIMLTLSCLISGTAGLNVQAAALEDSMLKPAASQSEEGTKEKEKTSVFSTSTGTITTAAELVNISQDERIERIGQMCQQDYAKTGVLASVSAAQCILESGYLTTELATEANNCFGMKGVLSGNSWENSTWDGESLYTKETGEEYGGQNVTIVADFRKYASIEESVADHSAYLLGATNGDSLRYEGLKGETDYVKCIQIIKDGGYATDSSYVDKICSIIERFDLTRFDELPETEETDREKSSKKVKAEKKKAADTQLTYEDTLYRIRKDWEDVNSQLGAYSSQENAKKACKEGYSVFDSQGNSLYSK